VQIQSEPLIHKPPFLGTAFDLDLVMSDIDEKLNEFDNGGRRSGTERRNYSYSLYIPDRRREKDRRAGKDRRKKPRVKINTR
jgi:hypothetical protein